MGCPAHRPSHESSCSGPRASVPVLADLVFLGPSSMLVCSNGRAIDKQRLQIRIIAHSVNESLPNAFLAPAREACIHGMPVAQFGMQVTPRAARSGDP